MYAASKHYLVVTMILLFASACILETDLDQAPDGEQPQESVDGALDIQTSVAIGAFEIELKTLEYGVFYGEREYELGYFPGVRLQFQATNLSEAQNMPFYNLEDDGILLEIGDEFVGDGEVSVDSIPGLRSSTGTIVWFPARVSPVEQAVRGAVLSFGYASQNQAVIPVARPADAVANRTFGVSPPSGISDYLNTNFEFSTAEVRYQDYDANVPLAAGTAQLNVDMTISAGPDMGRAGLYWGETGIKLARPDGVVVSVNHLNEAIYPGDREELRVVFELASPVSGLYTLTVENGNEAPVERQIMISE